MPSERRVSWAKFRVLAVSLVASLILLTLVYLLTGGTLLSQKVPVYLYLPDGEGLEKDGPVRVDGVDVGLVKTVVLSGSPDPKRAVKVTMDVQLDRLSSIPTSSEAEISSDNLIGDRFVDITSHPAPATVSAGGEIHVKESAEFKAIDIQDLEKQVLQVDTVLRDLDEGRGPVGQFVQRRQMYDDVVKRFTEIDRAFAAAVAASTDMGSALYKDDLYRQLFDAVMRVDTTLARMQAGQGGAGLFLRDSAQYVELQKSIRGIRQSVADLHAEPMMQSSEMYADWNRRLALTIQQVDDMNSNPAFNTSEAYDSLSGMAKDLRDTLRDFRSHPEKFLRIKLF